MPQSDRVQAYFNSRAGEYLKRSQSGIWDFFRQREYKALAQLLSLEPGLSVLDAGCGAGFYSVRLREDFQAEVYGVDLSPQMIAQARAKGIAAEAGDFTLFQSERQFDRVLIAGMLEFVADVDGIFRSAARALKPGGRVVALVPTAGLTGWAYALAHNLAGCPTQSRSLADYRVQASYSGLQFVEFSPATPISVAASWVK